MKQENIEITINRNVFKVDHFVCKVLFMRDKKTQNRTFLKQLETFQLCISQDGKVYQNGLTIMCKLKIYEQLRVLVIIGVYLID